VNQLYLLNFDRTLLIHEKREESLQALTRELYYKLAPYDYIRAFVCSYVLKTEVFCIDKDGLLLPPDQE
jgi:hypothetical protein